MPPVMVWEQCSCSKMTRGIVTRSLFASRELKGGEPKYHSSKLEFLALKWAITEQFREYLQYKGFMVRTDNNPLTYIWMP